MILPHFNSLKSLIESNLNAIKKVDWYNEQYSRYKDLKANAFPIAYIEFPDKIYWEQSGNNAQKADVEISIHVVMFDLNDSPEGVLAISDDVFKELNRQVLWNGTEQLSTELIRSSSELVKSYDQLKIVIVTFRTNIIDTSGEADSTPGTINDFVIA